MATQNAVDLVGPAPYDLVINGLTGQTTLTDHGVLVGAGSSAITQLAVGGNNSIMVGSASADPSFSTSAAIYVTSISFDTGSNAISNYSTGTFTPTLTPGTPTYTAQNGYYTRIGNLVYVQAYIAYSGWASAGSSIVFGGLPFTIKNQTVGHPTGTLSFNSAGTSWLAGYTYLSILGGAGSTAASITKTGSAKIHSSLASVNTSGSLYYSMWYQI
jgi:hypothetical protein